VWLWCIYIEFGAVAIGIVSELWVLLEVGVDSSPIVLTIAVQVVLVSWSI